MDKVKVEMTDDGLCLAVKSENEGETTKGGGGGEEGGGGLSVPPVAEQASSNWSRTLPNLPDELWVIILSHLTHFNDLKAAVNAHKDWRRLLSSQQLTLLLFPNVLPFLTKYLRRRDILNLRLVSEDWSRGVDEFAESAQHLAPYGSSHLFKDLDHLLGKRAPIWRQTDVNFPYRIADSLGTTVGWYGHQPIWFGRTTAGHPRSPLIGRGLDFQVGVPDVVFYATDTFLPLVGTHLHFLNLSFPQHPNFLEMARLIHNVLRLVPNLRQLRLTGKDPKACSRYAELVTEGKLAQFLPTPHLPRLKTLQLDYSVAGPVDVFPLDDILVRSHYQIIERLEVNRWDFRFWHFANWNNLTELRLPVQTGRIKEKDVFSSLAQLDAPNLAKLCLTFPEKNSDCHAEVFQLLQHFLQLESLGLLFQYGHDVYDPQVEESRDRQREGEDDAYGWMFWHKLEKLLEETHRAISSPFMKIKTLQLKQTPIPLGLLRHFPRLKAVVIPGPFQATCCDHLLICDQLTEETFWESGICYLCSYDEDNEAKKGVPGFWEELPRLDVVTVGDRVLRRRKGGRL